MRGEEEIDAFGHIFERIISMGNLLCAWREFLRGKRKRPDVATFSLRLMDNIYSLHLQLKNRTYRHGGYRAFSIQDPKPRNIHKADVRDRLVHHAIYRILYAQLDRTFLFDSYSCRIGKGTHRAINRFRDFGSIVSQNHTKTAWVLQCDIRRFFASIDQKILKSILRKKIQDRDTLWLLDQVIDSFASADDDGRGLPLGNLTSQLLVNVYMNEFDQFVKRLLNAKYYIRYADDFVIFDTDRFQLERLLTKITIFLNQKLRLSLHPKKVTIRTLASGIDFLGWVHFPEHRVLRTTTKRRVIRRIQKNTSPQSLASYQGLLRHGNTYLLRKKIDTITESLSPETSSRQSLY